MTTITVTGNLAADPEARTTRNGRTAVNFTLIENRRHLEGETWVDDEPNVFRISAFGQTADNITASTSKGDELIVTGRLVTRRWTDKNTGEARTSQQIEARYVGYSLRFATVQATKNPRSAAATTPTADAGETPSWPTASIPEDQPF